MIAGLGRSFDHDVVAVGIGHDVEPPLELGDVLVVLPEHQRGQAIIAERQSYFAVAGLIADRPGSGRAFLLPGMLLHG